MLLKNILGAGALTAALASPALAEEHIIILTGFSYFPAITYAEPGDTIRFINESGRKETVVGRDAGWSVGPLKDRQEGMLVVTEETELAFFSAYKICNNGSSGEDGNCGKGNNTEEATPESGEAMGENAIDFDEEYGTWEEAKIKAEISFEQPMLEADNS